MIRVLIIEDEQLAAEKLALLLSRAEFDIQIMSVCPSVKKSVAWLQQNEVDLIFCDIHLSDGNAFGIFEQVPTETPVIFTTSYDQYAIKAFQQNSIDYLLKPIDERALERSLKKFESWGGSKRKTVAIEELRALIDQGKKTVRKRFLVSSSSSYQTINMEEAAYFYSKNKQSFVTTWSGRQIPIDDSLVSLEGQVDPDVFFRVNRNYLVHINAIKQLFDLSRRKMMLRLSVKGAPEIIVPEERARPLKRWLNS